MENLFLITELKLIILCIAATLIFISLIKFKKLSRDGARASLWIFLSFTLAVSAMYFLREKYNSIHLFTSCFILFLLAAFLSLKKNKIYTNTAGFIIIFLIIFSVSFSYISYTPYWTRQHDGRNFSDPSYGGHYGYIGHIYYYNELPDVSPDTIWCFYNPPLFYLISARIVKLTVAISDSIALGLENLQIMSFMYTMIFLIYVYKILDEVKIKKTLPVLLFIGLSPALVIMTGSVNNDTLTLMLSTMAIYYAIVWYTSDKLSDLIKIAITIGLAMMTKISAAVVALAIATIFLSRVIQNKKDFSKYVKHFAIFALISLPIGLWFPIKNLIKYDIPITYVQSVDPSNDANISNHNLLERLFKFDINHIKEMNINMSKENAEYNLYLTTIKSYIVDEYIETSENTNLKLIIKTLFYVSILITILYLINIVYLIVTKESNWVYFFILLSVLQIISYISFCFKFPFTFTMNFRYIVPTLISFGAIMGFASDNNYKLDKINTTVLLLFSTLSILMFVNLI